MYRIADNVSLTLQKILVLLGKYQMILLLRWRQFALIFLITILSACFQVTLPTLPSPKAPPRILSKRPIALIVRTEKNEEQQRIGHQFLLFFPVTSVYPESSTQNYIEKLVYNILVRQGYRVITATAESVEALRKSLAPTLIIAPESTRVTCLRV